MEKDQCVGLLTRMHSLPMVQYCLGQDGRGLRRGYLVSTCGPRDMDWDFTTKYVGARWTLGYRVAWCIARIQ